MPRGRRNGLGTLPPNRAIICDVKALLTLARSIAAACGPKPAPPPPATTVLPTDARCPDLAPTPTSVCLQDCGPPVEREGDPEPPYRWASEEDVASREQYGCPRCLDATVQIATPDGERAIASLTVGDLVYTEDAAGQRVVAPILRVNRVGVPETHRVVAVTLQDGRTVRVSAQHPLATGGVVADLLVGSRLSGSLVTGTELVRPTGSATWDILPAGATGHYWANGVVLGSTLMP